MKKPIKIALISLGCLVAIMFVGIGALVLYAKYFGEPQEETVSYYVEDLEVSKADFRSEFEEIYRQTLDNYSLYKSKGLDMDSLHEVYIRRVENPDVDKIAFGNILKEFFAALRAGHAFVYLRDHTAGYTPVFIEGRVFVSNPNEYMQSCGFNDKDEVVAVNGMSVPEWLDDNEKYTPASTDAARRLMTASGIFRSWADTVASYRVVRSADTLEINLPLKRYDQLPKTATAYKAVEWKVLNDSVGYINIKSMMDPVTDEFVSAYGNVCGLPYLVVDVRDNEGGNSGNGRDIAEYLIKRPQQHCVSHSQMMEPRDNAYKGKLYLLTSTRTFSAAESFALDTKESGDAVLVGSPTAGDTGNSPRTFKTSGGICFRLPTREPSVSPKGFAMEGQGIAPHYEVVQTVDDFVNGRDTVLDFTLELIQR